jgi:hypothetical protein
MNSPKKSYLNSKKNLKQNNLLEINQMRKKEEGLVDLVAQQQLRISL